MEQIEPAHPHLLLEQLDLNERTLVVAIGQRPQEVDVERSILVINREGHRGVESTPADRRRLGLLSLMRTGLAAVETKLAETKLKRHGVHKLRLKGAKTRIPR